MCRWEEGEGIDAVLVTAAAARSKMGKWGGGGSPSPSPRSPLSAAVFFRDAEGEELEEERRFLGSCFLCKRPLASGRDIYMYRGDTPFCSEECRGEQMGIDEGKEVRKGREWWD